MKSVARLGVHMHVLQNASREGEPGARELGVVRHELPQPAGLVGPVLRLALLVGDQQDEVGTVHDDDPYASVCHVTLISDTERYPY